MTRPVAALLLWLPLAGAAPLDLSSPELVAAGEAEFAKSCAVGYCHGSEGRSARGPALRDRVWDLRELHRITAEGVPGTGMPGWKDVIPDRSVWAVTAYVLSLSSEPPTGAQALVEMDIAADPEQRPELSAQATAGRSLFFDLKRQRRCGVCHEVDGIGSAVGPNLVLASRGKTPRELTRHILKPNASVAFGFEQVRLHLRSGGRIDGVLAEETDTAVRVFDMASVPPPLRSVPKRDIRRQTTRQRSSMPSDLDEVYTSSEIGAIVAFLAETAR